MITSAIIGNTGYKIDELSEEERTISLGNTVSWVRNIHLHSSTYHSHLRYLPSPFKRVFHFTDFHCMVDEENFLNNDCVCVMVEHGAVAAIHRHKPKQGRCPYSDK